MLHVAAIVSFRALWTRPNNAMNAKRDEHPYGSFIHRVEKPARYLGGEYQSVVKDWTTVRATFCLGFPDVYDIGMSHMGTKILYSIARYGWDR